MSNTALFFAPHCGQALALAAISAPHTLQVVNFAAIFLPSTHKYTKLGYLEYTKKG